MSKPKQIEFVLFTLISPRLPFEEFRRPDPKTKADKLLTAKFDATPVSHLSRSSAKLGNLSVG